MVLTFTVYGAAIPKGSMRAFNIRGIDHPVLTDANRSMRAWSTLIASAASDAIQQLPEADRAVMVGAVRLTVKFFLPRPKKYSGPKKASVPCVSAPDVDKLLRAISDALSKVAYHDDAQIVEVVAAKSYAALTDAPHVDIRVEPTAGVHPIQVPPAPLPLFAEVE